MKREEILSCAATEMNIEDIMLSKRSQSQNINTEWSQLYEISKIVKLLETEKRMMVTKSWGEESRQAVIQWVESFCFTRWKVLEICYKKCNIVSTKLDLEIIKLIFLCLCAFCLNSLIKKWRRQLTTLYSKQRFLTDTNIRGA